MHTLWGEESHAKVLGPGYYCYSMRDLIVIKNEVCAH